MLFTTDQQTLADLHILGNKDSIYSLFNHTRTSRGAAILEDMFRYPLNLADPINARASMIKYLSVMQAEFLFDPTDFDSLEQYLSDTTNRVMYAEAGQGIKEKIQMLVEGDPWRALLNAGISALIRISVTALNFIREHQEVYESPFIRQEKTKRVFEILSEDPFPALMALQKAKKLSQSQLESIDTLVRKKYRREIGLVLEYLYELDVFIAVSKVASANKYAFPAAEEHPASPVLQISGFYHPMLNQPVLNDIRFGSGKNLMFLTGTNMGGKSTLLKATSVCVYLAHMGFPVPAKAMSFSVIDGIYTTINAADDLAAGASHFYVEVLRLKKIAKEIGVSRKLFVVFDELFRGTNVKDAYEATLMTVNAFTKNSDCIFMVSTHITEAGEAARENSRIAFYFLPSSMIEGSPRYTYKLEEGISTDRHGMVIIEREGILEILKNGIKTEAGL